MEPSSFVYALAVPLSVSPRFCSRVTRCNLTEAGSAVSGPRGTFPDSPSNLLHRRSYSQWVMGRKSGRGGDSRLGLFDVRGHGMFAGDWAALWTERWSEWSRSRAGGGGGCAACPRDGVAPPRGARARRGGAVGRGGGRRFVRGAVPCWLRRVHLSGVAGCAAARAREVERLHDDGLTVPILSRPHGRPAPPCTRELVWHMPLPRSLCSEQPACVPRPCILLSPPRPTTAPLRVRAPMPPCRAREPALLA